MIKTGKTGGKLTADLLKWAMSQYLQQSRNPRIHHGKQSVKHLVRQGAGVKNIEITDKNIKSFEGKYYVFFKARDQDVLNAAFAEYAAKTIHRKSPEKPSVRQQLSHFKEVIKNMVLNKARNREKGGMEL